MKICKRCNFRIPENEFEMFGECGQCGNKTFEEV
jgi:hypothetical protein